MKDSESNKCFLLTLDLKVKINIPVISICSETDEYCEAIKSEFDGLEGIITDMRRDEFGREQYEVSLNKTYAYKKPFRINKSGHFDEIVIIDKIWVYPENIVVI